MDQQYLKEKLTIFPFFFFFKLKEKMTSYLLIIIEKTQVFSL